MVHNCRYFLLSGPPDTFVLDDGSEFRDLTEETYGLLLVFGSDNLLILAIDAFPSGVTLPMSFFSSGSDETDRLNLFPQEWVPVFNLLGLEAL